MRHGWIFEAILRLHRRGDAIDERTVTEELRVQNRLDGIGGPSYIAYLFNSTPTALHAETYGHLVERAAIRRRLLGAAGEIAQLAHDQEKNVEKVIDVTYTALQHRKGVIVVGEPGVGKTALGATLAIALRPHMKPDQVVIVTSPPHLTGKWQREIEMVARSVGVRVHAAILKRVDDVRVFMDADLPQTLKIGIIPREMMSPAQSLRLVGTRNTKPQVGGALCRLLEFYPERRYALDDFAPYAISPRKTCCYAPRQTTGELNPRVVDALADLFLAHGYKSRGTWLDGPCVYPERHKHGDARPSFGYNTASGFAYCHVCGTLLTKDLCGAVGIDPASLGGLMKPAHDTIPVQLACLHDQ